MISCYLEELEAKGYSSATLEVTKRWLKHIQAFFEPSGHGLATLKDSHLTDYQRSLSWQPGPQGKLYSPNSINQAVDVVRRFYRWANSNGLLDNNPAAHLVTRRAVAKPRCKLTPTEARKLLFCLDLDTFGGSRDRAILGLVLESRVTHPALARLDLGHFQPDTGALWLSGRTSGILSLSDGLVDDLAAYLNKWRPGVAAKGEEALFVSASGHRMTSSAFRAIIRTRAQQAEVPIPYSS